MKISANIAEVAALQPDYLGFIFYKGSKRYMGSLTPSVVIALPPNIKKTGVFVNHELSEIALLAAEYRLNAIQLHGTESAEYCRELKRLLKTEDIELIKAFGIDESFDFNQLEAYQDTVDYFLFDTKTPGHGGSGRAFNWELLKKYTLSIPYFLSGGIDLDSVEELKKIKDARLYAIDINSRFELEPGLKDIDKLIDFKNMLSY